MNLSDIVEDLYTRCPGIPEAVLVNCYRDAARRFLRRVRGWVADSTTFAQGSTTAEYIPTLPTDAELVDFRDVRYETTELERITHDQMLGRGWPDVGSPRGARLAGVDTLVFMPDPTTDISALLTARFVLRPTRTASTLPDDVVIRYADALEYGALSLVYATPGHGLSDMRSAEYYRALFNDLMDSYEVQATDNNMHGVARRVRYGGIK